MRYKNYLVILLFLCSCSSAKMVKTTLYFGQSRPDGSFIAENEWTTFKENQISRVFPEGCTIINAKGNWRDPETKKIISEPTYMVIYFYKKSSQKSKQIDSLRNLYKRIFIQQSVLRTDNKVKAEF